MGTTVRLTLPPSQQHSRNKTRATWELPNEVVNHMCSGCSNLYRFVSFLQMEETTTTDEISDLFINIFDGLHACNACFEGQEPMLKIRTCVDYFFPRTFFCTWLLWSLSKVKSARTPVGEPNVRTEAENNYTKNCTTFSISLSPKTWHQRLHGTEINETWESPNVHFPKQFSMCSVAKVVAGVHGKVST